MASFTRHHGATYEFPPWSVSFRSVTRVPGFPIPGLFDASILELRMLHRNEGFAAPMNR